MLFRVEVTVSEYRTLDVDAETECEAIAIAVRSPEGIVSRVVKAVVDKNDLPGELPCSLDSTQRDAILGQRMLPITRGDALS